MNKQGIYKIISPSNKVYIGQSTNIEKRWRTYELLNCKQQVKLYNSLNKYGVEHHKFEIIENCEIEELNSRERYWQDFYNVLGENGLNLTLVDSEELPKKLSEESLIKMRKTFEYRGVVKGKNNPMYGKKHSEETKAKISKAQEGKYVGVKNPMYGKESAMKGRKHTKESIEKMREVQMYGKNHASKIVIDLSNGVFYESASELAMIYNLNKYTLRSRLNGHLPNNTNFKYC